MQNKTIIFFIKKNYILMFNININNGKMFNHYYFINLVIKKKFEKYHQTHDTLSTYLSMICVII